MVTYRVRKPLLPYEGFTLEAALAPFRKILLQPLLMGPLCYLAYYKPNVFNKLLSGNLVSSNSTVVGLGFLLACGVVDKVNSWLSRWSVNNFVRDSTWDWTKEIVVITGGSSGIGAEMVRLFARFHIKTIIVDVAAPASNTVDSETVYFYKTDLTSASAISATTEKIRSDHGDPTVLINNAGIGTAKSILDEEDVECRRVFDVNIIAHFALVREFLPAMVSNNHGHIVTIASMASFSTQAQNVSYCATKAAALAFHEGLGEELRKRYDAKRVRTTSVHPAYIRTPLIESITKNNQFPGILLEPSTVAEAVVDQVFSGLGSHIILPARFIPVSCFRSLPTWMFRALQAGEPDILALSKR